MKLTNLGKGMIQSVGAVACLGLGMIEMACDAIGADVDCSYGEWDARHEAVEERRENMDYYSVRGFDWCLEHAKENFKEAFK